MLALRFSACQLSFSRTLRRHSSILAELEEPGYIFFCSLSFSFTGGARRGLFLPQGVGYAALVAESRGFGTPLLSFFLSSTPFASLLTLVFRSFSSGFHIKRTFCGPSKLSVGKKASLLSPQSCLLITPKPPSPDKHARKLERRSPRRSIKK